MEVSSDQGQRSGSLRVVVTDESQEVIDETARQLEALGHQVVAGEIGIAATVDAVQRNHADLALVAVGHRPGHALELVERVNDTSECPVVLLMDRLHPELVKEAVSRGMVAYADRRDSESLESAIALALRVFADLEERGRLTDVSPDGASRRAVVEQAKGVLMERHDLDEARAYRMLRDQARASRTRLVEVAESVVTARSLLASKKEAPSP